MFHTLHRLTTTTHASGKSSQRDALATIAGRLQTPHDSHGGHPEASQRQFHSRQTIAAFRNASQRRRHAVFRDAIQLARSLWSYRTDRPTRTAGNSPECVSVHSVRSETRSTSAASRTVSSGVRVAGESFVVIMTFVFRCGTADRSVSFEYVFRIPTNPRGVDRSDQRENQSLRTMPRHGAKLRTGHLRENRLQNFSLSRQAATAAPAEPD